MTEAVPAKLLWEQHCCLPLQPTADITELARYRTTRPVYLSVNVGYSPQNKTAATEIAADFRRKAIADGRFRLVRTVADIEEAARDGAFALAFDLEDSAPIEGELDNAAHFYDLGVRSMLPTYNRANSAGCGCLDTIDTGLTAYGKALVQEMNRIGMLVDGSHCSIRTGLDLADATAQPMIYSHSNFAALWKHPRNITDDQARACAETGGVIGVNGVGIFLGANAPEQRGERLRAMADHLEYGVELVGIEHVGIGSDYSFDHVDFNLELQTNPQAFSDAYTAYGPLQWVPPEDTVTLDSVLAERGWSPADIDAVCGGNFARVARQVWR
ncbi:membrane dipeptidase [Skermania sp. ID1734]|uniref:dipeptidase n=1 Tax=Skermania sp. ID1734 TaxID=2597516 RepID=UPI00117F2B36|nr:membrane dipeptidase [Skermania sp. ID1734]TSD99437.1 membrane dipeptidase [Skermania sp. ID1734]